MSPYEKAHVPLKRLTTFPIAKPQSEFGGYDFCCGMNIQAVEPRLVWIGTIGAQIFFDLDFHFHIVTNKLLSNKGIRDTREPGRNALPAPARAPDSPSWHEGPVMRHVLC